MNPNVKTAFRLGLAILAVFFFLNHNTLAQDESNFRVLVLVSGLHDRQGVVRVALYDHAEGFPDSVPLLDRAVTLNECPSAESLEPLRVVFSGLKPGRYAVTCYHDSNSNGRLDSDFFGRPKEEWGMSNNPRPRLRAPRFEEAQFALTNPGVKTVAIVIHR